MSTLSLTLPEIEALARKAFAANGCDQPNTEALVRTVTGAERDGCPSHGLFRVPGYISSLRSGKVNGSAQPQVDSKTPVIVAVDGDNGYAPLAIERGLPVLAEAAEAFGVAVMAITRTHHFAALWPETQALAERGLIGMACVNYMPLMPPAGGSQPLLGSNPISFAWPRPGKFPVVFDMATTAMALGEVQIAARDGLTVPPATGLDANGRATADPKEILKGMLLPFGGYKGTAIALMVELLAAGAVGEYFGFEAARADNGDGGPPRGGEFILAMSPALAAGDSWAAHCEAFFNRYENIAGARLPGARRRAQRLGGQTRQVNAELVGKITDLCAGGPGNFPTDSETA